MADQAKNLRKTVQHLRTILKETRFLSLGAEELETLSASCSKMEARLDAAAESILSVGLLGGTGVGKSTLLNALAGSEIAPASHRRPLTDKVLIYRHETAEIPPALRESPISFEEITFREDAVRQVLVCDLPDFDSIAAEHRSRVIQFIDHLDILVWVTSPEKYADQRFYAFLKDVPKSKENFYFVFNKVDILFANQPLETGYNELHKASARFSEHLKESGVNHPVLYAVSAESAAGSRLLAPWNQFPAFRQEVFKLRNAKEVAAIKTANVDAGIRQLFTALDREVLSIQLLQKSVLEFLQKIQAERAHWTASGKKVIVRALEGLAARLEFAPEAGSGALAGPGKVIAALAREWRSLKHTADPSRGAAPVFDPETELAGLKDRFEQLKKRMCKDLHAGGLPAAPVAEVEEVLDELRVFEKLAGDLRERFSAQLELFAGRSQPLFRFVQYACYGVLGLLLFLALAGEAGRESLFSRGDWRALPSVFMSAVIGLFGSGGLGALLSFLLLSGFLGWQFYRRHRKSLRRQAQRFIDTLERDFVKRWDEELDLVAARLMAFRQDLAHRASVISSVIESPEGAGRDAV